MKKLLLLITMLSASISANASLITIDVEDKIYQLNDTVTADIYISDINNGFQQLVSLFSFDLLSQDSLLTLEQVTFGDKLDVDMFSFIPSDQVVDNSVANSLSIEEFSFADAFDLLGAQGGFSTFLLASVEFKVTGLGIAEFSLMNADVGDENFISHQLSAIQSKSVQLGNSVTVPEPSTWVMFTGAFLLVMLSARLRQV